MILGIVTSALTPTVELILVGTDHREAQVTFGVDTGFNGHLSATPETIQSLGWMFKSFEDTKLADGSEPQMALYRGIVMWHGQPRIVNVLSAPGPPFLGMGLLEGSKLTLDAKRGGDVTIAPFD